MKQVAKIGELELEVNNYAEHYKESPFSGSSLLLANFDCQIQGVSKNKQLLSMLKSKEITFKSDIKNEKTKKMKGGSKTWSYIGHIQTESTIYNHHIELEEIDPDEPEKWNLLAAQFERVIMNQIELRTLSELLQEKRIFTKQEYKEKLKRIDERDYEKLRKLLTKGPKNFGKKKNK